MWRRQTSRRRAGFYGEAFADLAGRDPARAAQAGTRWCLNLGILAGAAGRGSLPHGSGHRAGTRGQEPGRLAANPGAQRGISQPRRVTPVPGISCAKRCGCPGSPTCLSLTRPQRRLLAFWHLWRGELGPARDLLQAVLDVAERQGSPESAEAIKCHLVEVEWRAGNWDTAAAYAAAGAQWDRETSYGQDEDTGLS